MDEQNGDRYALGISTGLTVLAVAMLTWWAWPTWDSVVDDAYISGRYAEHLADGLGLVFSAEEPPVEGITNMAWTLALAVGRLFGISMITLMTALGWVFGALAVVLATLLAQQLSGRVDARNALAALLVANLPHMAVATTNGLESSMMVAAVLGAVWTHLRFDGPLRWVAGLTSAVLIWTRPEGIAVCLALVGHDLWRHRAEPAKAIPLAVSVVLAQGALTLFRLAYYGALRPNTFAAKSSFPIYKTFDINGPYLKPEISIFAAVGVAFLVSVVLRPFDLKKGLTACLALGLGFIPLTVNLWMPGLRLFLPAMSLVACMLAAACTTLPMRRGWALALVSLLAMGGYHYEHGKRVRHYDWRHTVLPGNGTEIAAKHLAAHAGDDPWLATRDAGVFAYYVGTGVKVAELHQRALTQPHPDGKNTNPKDYTPDNPAFFASTIRRDYEEDFIYGNDRATFRRFTEPYVYLGRVKQHYHRFYDVYARKDLKIPPLPKKAVVNFRGPKPEKSAKKPVKPKRPRKPKKPEAP